MDLKINPSRVELVPMVPQISAGVACVAALAGEPEALADWLVSALKGAAHGRLRDGKKTNDFVRDLLAQTKISVEFV